MTSITLLTSEHFPAAAHLFTESLRRLRRQVPDLPDTLENERSVIAKLERLNQACPIWAAYDNHSLVGYLSAFYVDDFRDTGRKAAYAPEWAHAALEGAETQVYNALYRQAAARWQADHCQMHAISLLAGNPTSEKTWFWNGFGLTGVDAIRSIHPLEIPTPTGFILRQATIADAGVISLLEAEHFLHYSAPPVCMAPRSAGSPADLRAYLNQPDNSIWLAFQDDHPAAYLQFENGSFGSASIVQAEDRIAITGAYTRPAYRGHKLAPALLDAGLKFYAAKGFARCSVDFESLNPEAAVFWTRYFQPVSYSLIRVPENCL